MDDIVDLVRQSLDDGTAAEFEERVDEQAAELRRAIAAGEFDNDGFSVGLEIELYAVNAEPEPVPGDEAEITEEEFDADLAGEADDAAWNGSLEAGVEPEDGSGASLEPEAELEQSGGGDAPASLDVDPDSPLADDEPQTSLADDAPPVEADPDDEDDGPYMDPEEWTGRLTPLPDALFDGEANKELGVHNAEVNTEPDSFDETGLEIQTTAVEMGVEQARRQASTHNCELVLDAMWTIPPEAGSETYLSAHETRDGVVVADNMRPAPRYVALDNEVLSHAGGSIPFEVPGYEGAFPTILFESLATSIQPHLQVPDGDAFPAYYNAAIRTLGPLLALSTNSPFLPADLYEDVDGEWLCANTHHELRIAAFEQSVNTGANPKVRVPRDIDATPEVVDRVVEDDLFGPFLREWLHDDDREGLHDGIWEFDHKRGTYWRWLRCVVGGDPVGDAVGERSLRIEYRPLPTQPHPKDLIGLQVLTVGLIRGLVAADHPLAELPWREAERSFYNAARDGPEADLSWVTVHGERTTDHDVIYDEVFEFARQGLAAQEISADRIDEYLDPIERRYEAGETPSTWKIDRVRAYLDDGRPLAGAITETQRDYLDNCHAHHAFHEWV